MTFLAIVLLAFAPGIFWLWFFARKDVYRPEPKRLIALTFFLGMLATVPAALIEGFLVDETSYGSQASLSATAATMFFIVGPVEEVSKFVAVRLFSYRSLYFDEPMDGLLYATVASLGFASLENLVYILAHGPAVMVVRAPLSTLAHLVFGSIWGYALGLQKHSQSRKPFIVLGGLAAAAVAHGLFNTFASMGAWGFLPVVGLTIVGTVWVMSRFNWAQRVSPFRYKRNYPRVECPVCRRQVRVTSRFCRFCGTPVHVAKDMPVICGYCSTSNRADAHYCTQCGDRLLR